MGQQQLLLIILGVIIIGIAIVAGISLFQTHSIQSEKDAIITELTQLAADAKEYFRKPAALGGGDLTYLDYSIPGQFQTTQYAAYSCTFTDRRVFFKAISVNNPANTVQVTLGRYNEPLFGWTFTGEYQ